MMNDYEKCTTYKRRYDDYHKISCKLGLWSVIAPSRAMAEIEAQHYFRQYKADGEYSEIIGGESVLEKLMKSKA